MQPFTKSLSIFFFLLLSFQAAFAQEAKLATQYLQNGEYEKAKAVFEKLYKENEQNDFYFSKYLDCLMALEQYAEGEKIIKKQLKQNPKQVNLYVLYGNLLEKQLKDEEAKQMYEKAIAELPKDGNIISNLANQFQLLTKYEFAIKVYEKGGDLLKDKNLYAYNLAGLYGQKGDNPKMIASYLDALAHSPHLLNLLKNQFERSLSNEDFQELQTQLYSKIEANEDEEIYPELLSWVFVHKKDYKNALRQAKALDRKLQETGTRVYNLAEIAAQDKSYDVAIEGFNYIVEEKGPTSGFYVEAKRESLKCQRKKLVEGFQYTKEDLLALEKQYEDFLTEFGRKKTTASIIAELADLEAFYLNNLDKAIALLKEMIDYPQINRTEQANGKISLGDFYLMKGEVWEATLLYSQVDKAFKDDILGQEARFRNAKLSYYAGDFEWAQAQFDVLKASTSKLIANDALDLSVFIMDNLGLDTTAAPLKMYAEADLLIFQNRFKEAFIKMDSLKAIYPNHSLEDDLLYMEAKVAYKKLDFAKSASILQNLIDKYTDSIRVDNALFELAQMCEHINQLNDKPRAIKLYERILQEFSGSTFSVEARKRYRALLGENIQG